jgi:hypothetical protein
VRGVNAAGKVFELDTVLENISGGGAYLVVPDAVEVGAELALVVRFDQRGGVQAPRVAMSGSVVRIEPQPSGDFGVAVAFTRHRFLSRLDTPAGGAAV